MSRFVVSWSQCSALLSIFLPTEIYIEVHESIDLWCVDQCAELISNLCCTFQCLLFVSGCAFQNTIQQVFHDMWAWELKGLTFCNARNKHVRWWEVLTYQSESKSLARVWLYIGREEQIPRAEYCYCSLCIHNHWIWIALVAGMAKFHWLRACPTLIFVLLPSFCTFVGISTNCIWPHCG